MPTNVALLGVGGKMGVTLARAILDLDAFNLAAAVDPSAAGLPIADVISDPRAIGIVCGSLQEIERSSIDVALDFTNASAAHANLSWCAANGLPVVCGTTGFSPEVLDELAELFSRPGAPSCLIAPNFAISAVLAMRFAEMAAPYFEGVEVIELHHNQKVDAPSGTAIETARRIAFAREQANGEPFASDPTTRSLEGARGATVADTVHVHAVRLPGLLAHQEVLFGSSGQSLIIRQDSYDRSSFVPGVVLALSKVSGLSGLVIGLDGLIGI